jgi:hypothetical protein
MRWHRCHLFKEAFDLKPMSGSRDKMRLVPLNTPGDTKIDPQYCSPKKKRCGAPLPTALQNLFWTAPAKQSDDGAFPTRAHPEGERHGAFVQVLPVQNG